MTIKAYFRIISIIGIVFGVGFLLAPEQFGSIFGYKETPDVELAQRFFGGALLAWALVAWFGININELTALRGVLIGTLIGHIAGAVVAVFGILSGVVNALMWPIALVYLSGAVGCAYFLMSRSQNS